jgi:hypothetical protein
MRKWIAGETFTIKVIIDCYLTNVNISRGNPYIPVMDKILIILVKVVKKGTNRSKHERGE